MIVDKIAALAREMNLNLFSVGEYYNGVYLEEQIKNTRPEFCKNICNSLYSISKNFSATAVGIAIDKGYVSLDDSIYDLFHDEFPVECTEQWKPVKVRHILSQTIGSGTSLIDVDTTDLTALHGDEDYLKALLRDPLIYPAGTHFRYSDANFYFAGRIVHKVTGEHMQDFLQHELFTPLHFQGHAWATCPQNHPIGGSGLYIRVCDLCKFGLLYLQNGVFEGKRILSEEWCKQATDIQFVLNENTAYGFSFWKSADPNRHFARGSGMYGQQLLICPDINLVVGWEALEFESIEPLAQLVWDLF